MSTLTANLHSMTSQFYGLASGRYKLFCGTSVFPSDQVSGHVWADTRAFIPAVRFRNHGFDPKDAIIKIVPGKADLGSGKICWTLSRKSITKAAKATTS